MSARSVSTYNPTPVRQTKTININKVTDQLFIGDAKAAKDCALLSSIGITHVLNASSEIPNFCPDMFVYKQLHLNDDEIEHIEHALLSSFQFIHNALRNPKNKVFVHCYAGISRSASVVIYYLGMTRGQDFNTVYQNLRRIRSVVDPNPSYVRQLRQLLRNREK